MDENTITTVFRADISQFSASTQELNRYIKTVNSEFDVATAGMGKWSDTTDGLTAKITQLNKILQAEKIKLEDMKKRYDDLVKAGKQNSKEAQTLAININKQTAVVKDAEGQIKHYEQSLKDLGDTSSSVGSKIAKGFGTAIASIGATAVSAVTGFLSLGESTREFRKEQAQLETAFITAGHSAETMRKEYAEFNAVLGDTAKTTEAMQQLAQFTKSEQELADYTNILTGVFATYGNALSTEGLAEGINHTIQLGEVQGSLADALEWGGVKVDDFNKQLAKCNTEEERSALISKQLNELYGEQAEHYKENNKDIIEAEKAQTRLTQAMADLGAVAEPIMTMLKNLAGDLLEAIKPFVELMGEGLKGAFEGSADGATKFAEGLTGIIDSLVGKVNEMLPTVVDLILKLIPTLISAILNALPSLVSTFAQIVSQIITALGQMIPQIVSAIVEVIPQVVQALIDAIPMLLDGALQFWLAIVEALPKIIDQILTMLPDLINTIIDGLLTYIPQLVDATVTLLMAICDAIPIIIDALIPQIPTIIDAIIDGLLSMLPVLLDGAITLLMAIIDALPTIINLLIRDTPKIVRTIVNTLLKKIPDIIQCAIQLFMAILEAIPEICTELIANLPEIITTIVDSLMDGLGDITEVGKELIKGLWEGIKSMGDWLWGKVKEFGGEVTGWFKKVFKIESPSKLFRDKIGENLALGIGEGFNEEIGDVTKDMQKHLKAISPALNIDTSLVGSNNWITQLKDIVGSRGGNVVNNYKFEYTFEKMETSKIALHKAQLETKRAIGG